MRALLALSLSGCRAVAPPPDVPDVVLLGHDDVVEVVRARLADGPRVSGRLLAEETATLKAEVSGSVRGLTVELGERVHRGEVLLRIEAPATAQVLKAAQSAVAAARADLATAEKDLERMQRMYTGGAVARHDVEVARTTVDQRRSALAQAASQRATAVEQIGHTVVTSPLDGRTARVPVHDGDVVTVGQELLTVLDPTTLRLEASVPTAVVGAIDVGTRVRFDVQGVPGEVFDGSIRRVGAAVDPQTGQLPVLIELPNPDEVLPAGLFAEGRLQLPGPEGLIVPFSAVDRAATPPQVKRVGSGRVEVLAVRVVAEDDRAELAEISGPVAAGDLLLVGPVRERLADGAAVELASAPPAAKD